MEVALSLPSSVRSRLPRSPWLSGCSTLAGSGSTSPGPSGEGDQHKATQEKFSLEEAQRQRPGTPAEPGAWTPQLFHLDPATQEWRYPIEK